jgi:predicted enzyme related to lactoylglutathione lyase
MASLHHDNAVSIVSAGVNVYVSDVLRAHRWYSDVLGLKMEITPDEQSSRYCESRSADDQGLVVFRLLPGSAKPGLSGNVQLAFSVAQLDKTVAELRSIGATFARERSQEQGCVLSSVTVLDPDGNGVVLYEK